MTPATRWILLACVLVSGMDLGGSFYEGALIVPVWSAAPPATLGLIQPKNGGINLIHFWVPIHTLFTILILTALALCWKDQPRKKLILGALASYAVMRIWTFAYFIPEIAAFTEMATNGPSSPELTARAARWGLLSNGRAVLVLITTFLMMKAALPENRKRA
jgi:hypothetical protein